MGYRVNCQTRNGRTTWGVIFEEWKNNERHDRRVRKHELLSHGFRPDMTVEEAKAWAASQNAKEGIEKRDQRKHLAAQARLEKTKRIECAYLPPGDCEEFETTKLYRRFARNNPDSQRYKKIMSHWRYVQTMIAELTGKGIATDPQRWAEDTEDFYNYFAAKKTSPSYAIKVIRILNMWGAFYGRKHGMMVEAVECPRGFNRSEIEDAYIGAKGRGTESDPLTPEMLENCKSKLTVSGQYEWLFVGCWLGLRPSEIDKLADRDSWDTYYDAKSRVNVLRIYQGKLKNVSRDKRFKLIPIVYPEQKKALAMIQKGGLDRPLGKTLHKVFKGHVTLYGPRKGFFDTMVDRGEDPRDVSDWLGHRSDETTRRHYQNKQIVRFKGPKAA